MEQYKRVSEEPYKIVAKIKSFLMQKIEKEFFNDKDELNIESSIENSIIKGFLQIQGFLEDSGIDLAISGSTLTSIFIKDNFLICVNIGDSKAILAKKYEKELKVTKLSTDHIPSNLSEKDRIITAGGFVDHAKGNFYSDEIGNNYGPLKV